MRVSSEESRTSFQIPLEQELPGSGDLSDVGDRIQTDLLEECIYSVLFCFCVFF